MGKYGWNHYPREYGGGKTALEVEHEALLDALAPGWDASEDTASYAELYAYALAISMVWAVNRRLSAQAIPSEMQEALPVWEEILKLRPLPTDSLQDRRALVAAKLRGIAENTRAAIEAVCVTLGGANYVEMRVPSGAEVWAYWPMNPGPPGLEWSSNRACLTIVLTQSGLTDSAFFSIQGIIKDTLNDMAPAWLTWEIGVDGAGGFVAGVGIAGLTFVGGP